MSGEGLDAEVVIVGGGPVGMLIAAELAAFAVAAVVVESAPAISDQPKATTLHARAVQSLVRRGYLPGLPRPGQGPPEPFHFAGLPGLHIAVPPHEPRPAVLKRPQKELEREFGEQAVDKGAVVLRRHRVTAVRQSAECVEVTAETPTGTRVLRGRYLVGADGARSTVRTLLGCDTEVSQATVAGMVGRVRFPRPDVVPLGMRRTERGWTVARMEPDGMGLIRTLDCTRPHDDRDRSPTLAELSAEATRIVGHEVPMTDPVHFTRFSDYTRLVRRYRHGRVFLAGDAAHVHFPIGGQGLSTGLLDGLNLAWKLAFSVRGTAGKDLLDSYDAERRPAARRVIHNTRAQLSLMHTDAALNPLREMFTDLLEVAEVNRRIALLISAQDTVYTNAEGPLASPWVGRFLQNYPLSVVEKDQGNRNTDVVALLHSGRPLFLIRKGISALRISALRNTADRWSGIVRVVTVAAGLPCEALLVRPDGYIAWASDGGDLGQSLTRWFGER